MKELELYIHIPFCVQKCRYCDFLSAPQDEQTRERYVEALLREIDAHKTKKQSHLVSTIFFGGGTPSILPLRELERIVKALHECFDLSQVEEVTLEANPEDLTVEYLKGLRYIGFVNRLSIGIQSLDDAMLRLIGRRHTADQALAAVENAHALGFSNLSVDFIYGLPVDFQFSNFNFQFRSGPDYPQLAGEA